MKKIRIVYWKYILILLMLTFVNCNKKISIDSDSKLINSLKNGLSFAMSQPDKWHDPHGLVMIGYFKPFIYRYYDKKTYIEWFEKVSDSICISSDSLGVGIDALDYPDYPANPSCLGFPEGHETAVALIGMNNANITKLKGYSIEEFTNWLKYYPDNDQYSIGIRIQALMYGGVSIDDSWETATGQTVSLKILIDNAITKWREEKLKENLGPGGIPSDMLLHLAPSLIVFKNKYAEEFFSYKYDEILNEVFGFYESIMINNKYWGFKGETFATAHILEHYAMDKRLPKSLNGLIYMIDYQGRDGKFDLSNNNFFGAQVHGLKGLYACVRSFNFNY